MVTLGIPPEAGDILKAKCIQDSKGLDVRIMATISLGRSVHQGSTESQNQKLAWDVTLRTMAERSRTGSTFSLPWNTTEDMMVIRDTLDQFATVLDMKRTT